MPAASEAVQKIAGQWIFSASIFQCDESIFGQTHFTDNGTCVYLALGDELIGRGLGVWLEEGPFVGFELIIFQYVAASKVHVHSEPHRFRGFSRLPMEPGSWTGEWYFCPFHQPPRLVGRFKAHQLLGGLVPQLPPRPPEDVPEAVKQKLLRKLDESTEIPFQQEPKWQPHRIAAGDLGDIYYVPRWLEPKQADEFARTVDRNCEWDAMRTRDTQEFGASSRCPCGRGLLQEPLPQWQANIINALHNLGVFHPVLYPANSVRLNAYDSGQGIHPHLDGPVYFPRAAILSLGSHCVFDFYPSSALDKSSDPLKWDSKHEVPAGPDLPPGTEPALSLILEPGSLLVFSAETFIHSRHGIAAVEEDEITPRVRNAKQVGVSVGDRLKRRRRVALTIRHLLPRCACTALGAQIVE